MTDPVRKEILGQLERVSELAPDVRFGQLIANLTFLAAGPWDENLWEIEDQALLGALQQHIEDLTLRGGDSAVSNQASRAS